MNTPESYFLSQKERNRAALSGQVGQPLVVMDMEYGHTLVQYGELMSHTDTDMVLRGTIHDPEGAREFTIPEDDTVIVGKDELENYTKALLAHYEQDNDLILGIVAATIIDRFATDEERSAADQLCGEIAQAVIAARTFDEDDAVYILDAPATLKEPILTELRERLAAYNTLDEIQRDALVMSFVTHVSRSEGISELEALQKLVRMEA